MRYEKAKGLKELDFKRWCGVKKETFLTMCEVVREICSRETRGQKSVLSVEDQVITDAFVLAGISNACFIWGKILAYKSRMFRG